MVPRQRRHGQRRDEVVVGAGALRLLGSHGRDGADHHDRVRSAPTPFGDRTGAWLVAVQNGICRSISNVERLPRKAATACRRSPTASLPFIESRGGLSTCAFRIVLDDEHAQRERPLEVQDHRKQG